MTVAAGYQTKPADVHKVLGEWMLTDGLPVVFDQEGSHGAFFRDARTEEDYLDMFSFFGTLPLGYNHPSLSDEDFQRRLLAASLHKPSNSDIYSQPMADFVTAFSRTLPEGFRHLFFIEGGSLAVENALKVAFDWKVRKNMAAGRSGDLGALAVHFQGAFHGRSGYTLSLTNTFSRLKTQYFPKLDWPRVSTPGLTFPLTEDRLAAVEEAERRSLGEIKEVLAAHPHDVACIILEPVQAEGGDVHLRGEFLRALRELCDEEELLLIFDEVQTGMGLTGRWWAQEHFGVRPDIFSFGKKSQVCGIAATQRVDDVESCFKVPGRINSTWGGGLADMVRCTRYIEIIEEEGLLENASSAGAHLLERVQDLERRREPVSNARGLGLMCAFDLPDSGTRDRLRKLIFEQKMLMLPCGSVSLRFRPVLDVTREQVDLALDRIEAALEKL